MPLECPRCALPLRPDTYEGVPVEVCRECWGYWLDRGEFARVVDSRRFVFSAEERARILAWAAQAAKSPGPPEPLRACPRCGKPMEKVDFGVKAPIVLDRCAEHGIWFDTRELKLAQVLAEDAAAVRTLFFRKLREP